MSLTKAKITGFGAREERLGYKRENTGQIENEFYIARFKTLAE